MSIPQIDVIPRAAWGARHENGFGLRPVGRLEVYLHHSVTVAPDLLPPFTDDYAAVRTLENIGEARFGRGISYHFPISPAGLVFEGVSIDRVGAAIEDYNTPTANIVLIGNYDREAPPRPMLEAVDGVLRLGVAKGWWREARLAGGHQDAPGASTACPGRYAQALIDDINRGAYRPEDDGVTPVDNPVTPLPPAVTPQRPGRLTVDGFWGGSTTRALQRVLGTVRDGVVSSQPRSRKAENPGLTSGWVWESDRQARGSQVIAALQAHLRMSVRDRDGMIGPDTIRRLQRYLGVKTPDGVLSRESRTIMALQRRLNEGDL
jgi:hypothetical protein